MFTLMRISATCILAVAIAAINAGSVCMAQVVSANCQCVQESLMQQLQLNHSNRIRSEYFGCCDVAAAASALQVPVPRPCTHLQVASHAQHSALKE
jgi:hypothetical protein